VSTDTSSPFLLNFLFLSRQDLRVASPLEVPFLALQYSALSFQRISVSFPPPLKFPSPGRSQRPEHSGTFHLAW